MSVNVAQKIALWADRLRDISARGLQYAESNYDRIHYRALQDIAMEMCAYASGQELGEIEPLRDTLFSHHTPLTAGDAAVIDDAGRILLMQRTDNRKWAMPGGGFEVCETPAEGAVREAYEETGVRCQPIALVGVFDSRLWGFISRHHFYAFTFLCRPMGDIPSHFHNDETIDIGWFTEDALPEPIHDGHPLRIPMAFRAWRGEHRAYFDT
jgi:8-oxo-dGTP pyrophosphatase MutT (NUDIX family)